MHFHQFKNAVAYQFERMKQTTLFRTGVNGDAMWETYLSSFPEGTNPIYRERREYDCSCCRHFVKTIGDVVSVVNNQLVSIWDIEIDEPAYRAVAERMSHLVKCNAISNRFLHYEPTIGTDKNYEEGEIVKTWEHFFVRLPQRNTQVAITPKKNIGPILSETRATHDVFLASLRNITDAAVDTVLDLINQNNLYRGEEHKNNLVLFRQARQSFGQLLESLKDNWVWSNMDQYPASVTRIKNTSIGTLLMDLSTGRDVESAVTAFERMVAPTNYKRPKSIVTQAMVNKAKDTVASLGLTSALERRYARLTDITVNNVLFADRSARKAMAGDPFDGVATKALARPRNLDDVQKMPIETFLSDILPGAESLELLVENRHTGNLVSLIAPVDPGAGKLFKWDNRFSWSYHGDVTDSIKDRVKKAGGNVTGELCCRLAWFNTDDLDLHMIEPNGEHIYYGHKHSSYRTGGQLDVDMNVRGETREPVENIFYPTTDRMPEGPYHLFVHQFYRRENVDVGFEAEIDFRGQVHKFTYNKIVSGQVTIAKIHFRRNGLTEIVSDLPSTATSRKVWDIDTEAFHRANVVLLSPNHWDGHGVGNRHYFFMLDGCRNDGTARGFYNEFLRGDLDQHRKVLEIVGSKMRTEESQNQLGGLGFSSTQRNDVVVRVNGNGRLLRITF